MASYGNGTNYLDGVGMWGILTMLLMTKAAGNSFFKVSTYTSMPKKLALWYLMGSSIAATVNVLSMK